MGGLGSKVALPEASEGAPQEAKGGDTPSPAAQTAETVAMDYSKLPKVELHLHLDGACRTETLRELAIEYQLPYPTDDIEAFKKHVCLLTPQPSLKEFLKVFGTIEDILRTKEAVERIAYEYCEDLKKQNCLYFECRFNPKTSQMSAEEFMEAALAGLERGERDFGVKSRIIVVFMTNSPETTPKVVDLAIKYKDRGVVAVDIAGDETLPMTEEHKAGFLKARKNGLCVTVHAGESGPASNVRQAIEELGAQRIGHGYHVLDDEAVYQLAKERNIHFEACLTSSVFTNSQPLLDSHAVKRWAADGISFSLNTDDPGVMQCDLQGEYRTAAGKLGLTAEQIIQSVRDGVSASFLPEEEREKLLEDVNCAITEWEELQVN